MDRGDKNRSVSGTKMNATSSRAHTVVTITFKKITKNPQAGKPPLTMESDINLVDLAGSEKSDQAGTTGDRLKEGNAINQSLTSLGNVIEALAENSKGGKPRFIPYRDSNLTRMLQEGLGGNSSTIMVCAIRPGLTYYDETNNTLVWADRAKKIKNKPVINESPQDKIIRELQEENRKLREQFGGGGGGGGNDPEMAAKLKAAQEEMERNQRQLEEMQKSWEQKLKEAGEMEDEDDKAAEEEAEARASGRPQLLNLNEDGMLDRRIFFDLSKHKKCDVGRKRHDESADPLIVLGGVGVQEKHAVFETNDKGTTLKPLSKEATQFIFINGNPMKSEKAVKLVANDRVIFGSGSVFLFRHEDQAASATVQDTKEKPITHEFAIKEKSDYDNKELQEQQAKQKLEQEAQTAAAMAALHAKMEVERKAKEEEQAKLVEEFNAKMAAMQAEIDAKKDDEEAKQLALEKEAKMRVDMERQIEQEKLKSQKDEADRLERIRREEAAIKKRQAEFSALEKKLAVVLPLVNEGNLIAKELKRDVVFNTKMIRVLNDAQNLMDARTEVVVRVENFEEGYYYQWDTEKFQNRLFMMRD